MASVSVCKFNCLDVILTLKYRHSPPPKQFLSRLNTLYWLIGNWLLGKDSSIFVSKTKDTSKIGLIINFKDSNLFLRELMFKWLIIKFLGFYSQKVFISVKQSVSLLEGLGLWLILLEFPWGISIFLVEWEQEGSEQLILKPIKHFQWCFSNFRLFAPYLFRCHPIALLYVGGKG